MSDAAEDAGLYEEDVAASEPVRAEQLNELGGYIDALRSPSPDLGNAIFRPDFSSEDAYTRSAEGLRGALAAMLGYPPPGAGASVPGGPEFAQVGEDRLATYFRCRIPVLPGVHAVGLYLVPRGLAAPAPLVIAMHGGAGSPELATFHGGANYHDMVRGAVRQGYAVWAPTHLFRVEGEPADIRQRTDRKLRLVGTTLTAVEIFKVTRGLSSVLARPEVDPARVAMIGLSYGGYYTQLTAALDGRIKAAVSSCFFGWRTAIYWNSDEGGNADRMFPHAGTLFPDPEIAALICPRPFQVQMGTRDDLVAVGPAREQAPRAAAYYERLGRADRFDYREFDGTHEWNGPLAWDFLARHL